MTQMWGYYFVMKLIPVMANWKFNLRCTKLWESDGKENWNFKLEKEFQVYKKQILLRVLLSDQNNLQAFYLGIAKPLYLDGRENTEGKNQKELRWRRHKSKKTTNKLLSKANNNFTIMYISIHPPRVFQSLPWPQVNKNKQHAECFRAN